MDWATTLADGGELVKFSWVAQLLQRITVTKPEKRSVAEAFIQSRQLNTFTEYGQDASTFAGCGKPAADGQAASWLDLEEALQTLAIRKVGNGLASVFPAPAKAVFE